jgi:tRNA threonylcarbamoyl adenosine modification protein (Sua5/YciO/YrdC/YwlC family)
MSIEYDCREASVRAEAVAAAARAVSDGRLVVLPTDTVYGVGADPFNPLAVDRLLLAKGRGRNMPVPVLVGSWRTVNGLVDDLPPVANELIAAFWPGPLTIVLRTGSGITWDLGEAKGTVAVRMPLHPVALELLAETGPLAVSSANKHGEPAATTAAAARLQLGEAVAVYLESGESGDAGASTIVDVTGATPRLLRAGALAREQLEEALGGGLDGPD